MAIRTPLHDYSTERRNPQSRDQFLESLPDCVMLLDLAGNILFINANGRERLGFAEMACWRGTAWIALWPPAEHAMVRAAVTTASSGKPARFEACARNARDEPKWWDVTVTPLLDRDHRVERLLVIARDVSALHLANEQAQATATRLQFGLDAAEIGHWDLDLQSDRSQRSAQHDRCFGYDQPRPNWGFEDTLRHVHVDDRAAVMSQFDAAVASQGNWSSEFRVIWPDGTVHWLIIHGAIYYVDGRPVRMGGIVYESTRRKQIELDLRQSRAEAVAAADHAELESSRLNALLEAAPTGIAYGDADGRVVLCNSEYIRLWGNHPLPGGGKTCTDWKGWWADGSDRHGQPVARHEWALARALRGEAAAGDIVEIEPFGAAGVRRTVLQRASPVFDKCRHATGAVIAQMDITDQVRAEAALRESEAKFRTIADAMPQMVWSTRPDGYHDYFNEQWYVFTGVPGGSTDGKRWDTVFHPEDEKHAWKTWQACLASGETYELQYRLRHKSGNYRWVLGRALPIRSADGTIVRWMGTCTDIHDQKMAETALQEKNRKNDEFLAMLGHELRNPLSAISTAATIIERQTAGNASIAKPLEVLQRQSGHLSRIIDGLLNVARVTAGKVILHHEVLDLADLVQSCIERLQAVGGASNWNISATTEAAWVEGDRTRLEQVIDNLLLNALKYTPQGGAIRVQVAADAEHAVLEVRDSGIGIAAELLPTIFELFVQAPSKLDRTEGGLGIGLTLVHQITALHDGTVTASSAGVNQGSVFVVRLPRVPAPRGGLQPMKALDAPPVRKVLLIEDNADGREMIAMALSSSGHEVLEAENGNDGLRLMAAENPTVAVIDIGLPDMNGFEIARHVRANPAFDCVHLIALTGYGQEADRRMALEAGFDEHLVKPVDLQTLLRCVGQ